MSHTTVIRKIGLTLALVFSVSTAVTSTSFAFTAAEIQEARQMCSSDAYRLCASAIPSIPKITACMRKNKAKVSEGCRALIDKYEAAANTKGSIPATQ